MGWLERDWEGNVGEIVESIEGGEEGFCGGRVRGVGETESGERIRKRGLDDGWVDGERKRRRNS